MKRLISSTLVKLVFSCTHITEPTIPTSATFRFFGVSPFTFKRNPVAKSIPGQFTLFASGIIIVRQTACHRSFSRTNTNMSRPLSLKSSPPISYVISYE